MKKTILILSLLLVGFYGKSQTPQQTDSANMYLRDSIYNVKGDFIGKPFAYLMDALGVPLLFSDPDGAGNKTKGMAYYKSPAIFLPSPSEMPLRGFRIEFTQKMPVDLGKKRAVGWQQWDILMQAYLRTAIVSDMRKL